MIYVDNLDPNNKISEMIMTKVYIFVQNNEPHLFDLLDDNVLDFYVDDYIKSDKIPTSLQPFFLKALDYIIKNYSFLFDNIDTSQLQYKYF